MGGASAGRRLVEGLLAHGVDHVFCVPGESYLPVLDALYDAAPAIRTVTCRHENGAAFMAEACGKLTGRPGVALVTRTPGAANAAIAVHVAQQDSTPMLLVAGQVAREERGREAFQEADLAAMFRPLAPYVAEVTDPAAVPAALVRAMHEAVSRRPGPSVLVMPQDVLAADCAAPSPGPARPLREAPSGAEVAAVARLLATAERPLLLVGGSTWDGTGLGRLASLVDRLQAPVAVSFRRQDLVDNDHPCYAGYLGLNDHPALAARVREADLLLVLGARLDQPTTKDYHLFDGVDTASVLVHVHPERATVGRNFRPALGVVADAGAFVAALLAMLDVAPERWAAWREAVRADYEASLTPPPPSGDGVDLGVVMQQLERVAPAETIVTIDAGNFTAWPQRYRRYRRPGRLLSAVCGAMGGGVPSAVAASLLRPRQPVVAMVGDGGWLMTGNELATAVQHGARPVILVANNASYGTIRLHQERRYPGRPIATDLVNPDIAAMAAAFGAWSARVARNDEVGDALAAAMAAQRPAVVELVTDRAQLTPGFRLPGR